VPGTRPSAKLLLAAGCLKRAGRLGRLAALAEAGYMSFAMYMIGFVIVIIGLGLAGFYLQVPAHWIGVGVVILIGLAVVSGARFRRE
jgi:hypothetical protein